MFVKRDGERKGEEQVGMRATSIDSVYFLGASRRAVTIPVPTVRAKTGQNLLNTDTDTDTAVPIPRETRDCRRG